MGIKIKYRDPKPSEYGPEDIIINIDNGTINWPEEKEESKDEK